MNSQLDNDHTCGESRHGPFTWQQASGRRRRRPKGQMTLPLMPPRRRTPPSGECGAPFRAPLFIVTGELYFHAMQRKRHRVGGKTCE